MRAIGVTTYGGPDALHELDVEPEPLGSGQVRVRVTAAVVNPTDTLRRAGNHTEAAHPPASGEVPGMDVAGTVLELADDVDMPYAVGDLVMGIVVPEGRHGGYRDDLVLPARSVTNAPAGRTDVEAATLPMNALTARLALDEMGLEPGDVLAVTGAAGAFGGYVVQLAKADGLQVIADASVHDEELIASLGADLLVRRGDEVTERILEHVPEGVDGLADGALQGAAVLPAIREGGVMATVRGYRGNGARQIDVFPVRVREVAQDWEKLDRLREQVESGVLTLRVAGTYPAAEAAKAHERLEAGGVRGRLVLQF